MITEDFVSFETAKLLKEKEFDEPCYSWYSPYGDFNERGNKMTNSDCALQTVMAPTLQMAMKWLREEHNFFIEIQCYGCEADEKAHFEYSYVISEYVKMDEKICTVVGLEQRKGKSQFMSYEQACEAAIKYCLEKLI